MMATWLKQQAIAALDRRDAIEHWKAKGLDFSRLFYKPDVDDEVGIFHSETQDHNLGEVLDRKLIKLAKPAIENGTPVKFDISIGNTDRTAEPCYPGHWLENTAMKACPMAPSTSN